MSLFLVPAAQLLAPDQRRATSLSSTAQVCLPAVKSFAMQHETSVARQQQKICTSPLDAHSLDRDAAAWDRVALIGKPLERVFRENKVAEAGVREDVSMKRLLGQLTLPQLDA